MRWRGRVVKGLGEASRFLSLPWVKLQIEQLLRHPIYLGTVNLEVEHVDDVFRWMNGCEPLVIEPPPESNFCRGYLYPVRIESPRACGAILRPAIANYPSEKVEVVAELLPIKLGDWLDFSPPQQ